MSKSNKNIDKLISPLITEILNSEELDNVKIDIIKEEIKNNSYSVNPDNIANKILELSLNSEEELTVEP